MSRPRECKCDGDRKEEEEENKQRLLLRKRNVYVYSRANRNTNAFIAYLGNLPIVLFNILFCVDSKQRCTLYALDSIENKVRAEIILELEVKRLVHI